MDQRLADGMRWGRFTHIAAAVGVLACSSVAAVSGAHARDAREPNASELLTPTGWEAGRRDGNAGQVGDELLTPSGWTMASEISWSGPTVCSELLIPADWSAIALHKRAR